MMNELVKSATVRTNTARPTATIKTVTLSFQTDSGNESHQEQEGEIGLTTSDHRSKRNDATFKKGNETETQAKLKWGEATRIAPRTEERWTKSAAE